MSRRTDRFILDLSDDEDPPTTQPSATPDPFIRDIIERTPSAPRPPTAPVLKQTPTGFPEHRKRASRLNTARGRAAALTPQAPPRNGGAMGTGRVGEGVFDKDVDERTHIDLENQKRIAAMSPEDIEQERNELLSALDPNLVRMLMSRAEKKKAAPVSDAALVHNMKGDLTGGGAKGGSRVDAKKEVGLEDYLKRANMDDGRGDTWVETPEPPVVEVTEDDASPAAAGAEEERKERATATRIAKPKGRRVEPTRAVHWLENDEAEPKEMPGLQPGSECKPRGHRHPSTTTTTSDQPTDTTADTTGTTTDSTEPIENTLHFPRPQPSPISTPHPQTSSKTSTPPTSPPFPPPQHL
ncbi:hypothetical protein GMDG_08191 [Pseudogymnoascus destructans 20631-21]|uniref:RPAP1 N-terminal domain-containing protein n=1 Tax=Pseudogymnoascus destructans (strain ATCC MYA-4855 / 20631-21) TaxID=658429 RepID=L8G1D6_PSED2|nr:hypothetical protein GMDG_08191 [Pseudogymnoascus destructans 20631-21]